MRCWLPCKRLRITESRNHCCMKAVYRNICKVISRSYVLLFKSCSGSGAGEQSPLIWRKIQAALVAAIHHVVHRCCVSCLTLKSHSQRIIPVSFLSFPLFLLTAVNIKETALDWKHGIVLKRLLNNLGRLTTSRDSQRGLYLNLLELQPSNQSASFKSSLPVNALLPLLLTTYIIFIWCGADKQASWCHTSWTSAPEYWIHCLFCQKFCWSVDVVGMVDTPFCFCWPG